MKRHSKATKARQEFLTQFVKPHNEGDSILRAQLNQAIRCLEDAANGNREEFEDGMARARLCAMQLTELLSPVAEPLKWRHGCVNNSEGLEWFKSGVWEIMEIRSRGEQFWSVFRSERHCNSYSTLSDAKAFCAQEAAKK